MRLRVAPAMILAAVLLASVPDAAYAQPPLQRDTWLLSGALGLALDADDLGAGAVAPCGMIGRAARHRIAAEVDAAVQLRIGRLQGVVPVSVPIRGQRCAWDDALLDYFESALSMLPHGVVAFCVEERRSFLENGRVSRRG